ERPGAWERWLSEALEEWRERSLKSLARLETENGIARDCVAALRQEMMKEQNGSPSVNPSELKQQFPLTPALSPERGRTADSPRTSKPALATMLQAVLVAREKCPYGKKTAWVDPLEDFFEEAEFFASLLPGAGGE